MKVIVGEPVKTFQPLEVTFVIETQAELDALGCCFNSGVVTYGLERLSGSADGWHTIFRVFKSCGADLTGTAEFNKRLRE